MCMLLGFSSNKRYELKNILKNFFDCSKSHPNGWGLALYNKYDKHSLVVKEPVPAHESAFTRELCSGSIVGRLAVAHIRYKTFGNVSFANTHPFVQRARGEDWILAHNGSVDVPHFKKLTRKPGGDTDSERVSCFIADRLDKLSGGAGEEEKIHCMEEAVTLLAGYGKLNLMITDGRRLYLHTNCPDTLYVHKVEGAALFCTKPLTMRDTWENVPLNRLFVYENGEKIFEGSIHKFEHKPQKQLDVSNYWGWH